MIGDLFGEKFLFESGVSTYFFLRGVLHVDCGGRVVLPPFTGKVVKSLLIRGFGGLEDVFSGGFNPKPIHVSPLYYRGRWLWKRGSSGRPISLKCGSDPIFYVGFREDVADSVFDSVMGINNIELFNAKWSILSIDVEKYELPVRNSTLDFDRYDRIIVEFNSPAILVDPYKASPSNPRYLPLAGVLFSYNIGDLLRMHRREHRWEAKYWVTVDIVNAALHEHRRILNYIKSIEYNYDGKIGVGVGGKAMYYVVRRILREWSWVRQLLESILIHAKVMGVGSSRANGFGHISVRIEDKKGEGIEL